MRSPVEQPFLDYDLAKSASRAQPGHEATMQWHTDNSYEENPASATMLYVHRHPPQGGATSVTDMIGAYRGLPPATKAKIEGLVAPHYMGPGIVSPHMRETYGECSSSLLCLLLRKPQRSCRTQTIDGSRALRAARTTRRP